MKAKREFYWSRECKEKLNYQHSLRMGCNRVSETPERGLRIQEAPSLTPSLFYVLTSFAVTTG